MSRKYLVTSLLVAALISIFLWAGCSNGTTGTPGEKDFTSISMGAASSITDERQMVIKDEQSFKDMWQHIDAVRGLPEIDFEDDMVIAVFMGEKPTGGYVIEIVSIEEYADSIVVNIKETVPGEDEMTTQALTYPYHVVSTDNTEKQVRFEFLR